jgi:glycosyltransferase involved in cell wall biosynthesis
MVDSVRGQMYEGIDYEFIIVDGGSTDGTIDWCKSQPDIHLIQHGELHGAIRAFCDGAKQAVGDYVIMANDDIAFHHNSIIAALGYLENNPKCGAVAFADNRISENHRVQHHLTRYANGVQDYTPYAQVGMYRRWLGDLAGWWGADDPHMSKARTYGGDNYLSARIWQMGYTIDTITGCRVDDRFNDARDNMRKVNYANGDSDSKIFYSRFPDGALFGSEEITKEPHDERLRVLYVPIYEGNHKIQRQQKRGLRDAFKSLGIVCEYDYVLRHLQGANLHNEIIDIARKLKPHILFTQFHDAELVGVKTIQQLRGEHPSMICLNWNGDVWTHNYFNDNVIQMLQWYDVALVVNNTVIDEYENQGISAAYWQVASEQPYKRPNARKHDIVFMANAYSEARQSFGAKLKALPYDVGLYGSGWGDLGDGETLYNYALSHSIMRNAKIVIGDNQYPDEYGFVSNRLFETLYAGGFLLHQPIKGLKELTGITPGKHFVEWDNFDELCQQIAYYMENEKERNAIMKRGQRYVKRVHTFDARVVELFTKIIPEKMRDNEPI